MQCREFQLRYAGDRYFYSSHGEQDNALTLPSVFRDLASNFLCCRVLGRVRTASLLEVTRMNFRGSLHLLLQSFD